MRAILFTLILALIGSIQVTGGEVPASVIKEFQVEPDCRYKLSFDAKTDVKGACWELRVLNKEGELPHSGYFKKSWQHISPDRQAYQHSFLTPRDGEKLQFIIVSKNTAPVISNIELQKIDKKDLVLNGEFSGGKYDFSGWNDTYKTELVEKDGKVALEVDAYGYALSDPVPVIPGETYGYPPGKDYSRYGAVLLYDECMLRIGKAPSYHHRKNKTFKMPMDVAYVRFLFRVKHTHIHKKITIKKLGFIPLDTTKKRKTNILPRASQEIILDADCDMRENRAARELQYWMKEITGKTMPVLVKPTKSDNTKIFIGSKWAGEFPEDLKFLADSDGFAVREKGKNIYIFGAKPAGTLFGVNRFLEENTDIIWARPHEGFGTVFTKNPDIQFTKTNFRSKPSFTMRDMSYPGGLPMTDTWIWFGRNGINHPTNFRQGFSYQQVETGALIINGGGLFDPIYKLNKFDELKKKHPKYFPMIDGKRMIKKWWLNPCFSNPGVVKAMIEGLKVLIKEAPDSKIDFMLCIQSDTWRVCSCPECMKPIKLPNGKTLSPTSPYSEKDPRFFSTRLYMMLNKVAEAMVKEYPDFKMMTHAYIYSAAPPAVDVHPAIKPQFAAYPTRCLRIPLLEGNDIWEKRFRLWREHHKNKGLSFFGYYYPDGFSAVADAAAADMKALADYGGYGVHNEGYPDVEFPNKYTGGGNPYSYKWDNEAIERWVIARLMWNPDQDPEALREYYIKRTFREAAAEMQEFFKLVRDSWHDPKVKMRVNCHSTKRDIFENFIVKPGLEKKARALLVQAEKKAVHPNSKMMIQRTLTRFNGLSKLLDRHLLPNVEEATVEWLNPVTPHWEKAVKFENFKLIDDWRVFSQKLAEQQTDVSIMRDAKNIYFRVTAYDDAIDNVIASPKSEGERFPAGDRIELVLHDNSRKNYLLAVGPNGNYYSRPKIDCQVKTVRNEKSWVAMISIPIKDLKLDPDRPTLQLRFGRVYRVKGNERKESTLSGRSIHNNHKSFWTNLSISLKGE